MYRQILVHPSDHNLQRIFWYDSQNQLGSYHLTTYGLSCAPFLAFRVLQQLITDEGHQFPKAISSLIKGRYVDDIEGAESIDETKEIISQVTQLCNADGFPLQKWHSNCPDLLINMSTTPSDTASAIELTPSHIRVLGLCWQPQLADIFKFISVPSTSRRLSKRAVSSEIAQLFDPLGFIAPIVISAKIFIQSLVDQSRLGYTITL